jgi:hypothetical protein
MIRCNKEQRLDYLRLFDVASHDAELVGEGVKMEQEVINGLPGLEPDPRELPPQLLSVRLPDTRSTPTRTILMDSHADCVVLFRANLPHTHS